MDRRSLIGTIVMAMGGGMVVFGVLIIVLTIHGTRQVTLSDLEKGFDRSAALAKLILDQEIEMIQHKADEIMRLNPLRQAVLDGNLVVAEGLLLHQARFDLMALFDGFVISRETEPTWIAGGFSAHLDAELLSWLASQEIDNAPGLARTRFHVMIDARDQPRLLLVVTRHFRDFQSGRRVASLHGAVILSDWSPLFYRVRTLAGLQDVGLVIDGHYFAAAQSDDVKASTLRKLLSGNMDRDEYIRDSSGYHAVRPLTLATLDDPMAIVMSVENPHDDARILVKAMAMMGTLVILVMASLLLFLTHYVGVPLRRLADHARQLPAGPLQRFSLPRFHARDELGQLVAAFNDLITRVSAHQQELDRLAYYDILTGVPNRRLLAERITEAIDRARRTRSSLAICYLDLDGFKPVNDRFGHAMGDRLLLVIAERLQGMLRIEDTLARLGGDEFVILLNDLEDSDEARSLFNRLLMALAEPTELGGLSLRLSASMGVTFFPSDDHDADTLIRHADQAMYQAKQAGKNRYAVFDLERKLRLQSLVQFIKCMEAGLRDGQFVLHYQPKVDLVSGRVLGAEALLRWRHPERGLLMPASFMTELSGSELDPLLGYWVIEQVLWQMAQWHGQGLNLGVSVNVSADHLLDKDFVRKLESLLLKYPQLPRDSLECEILETATFNDLFAAGGVIAQCKKLGVRFALDDFGTGFSSLAYFRSLPVDVLKIDHSFVKDMLDDPNDLEIVETMVGLALTFNKEIIAEGVENMAQAVTLVRLGCRRVQGFGIARPMPAEYLPAWISQWAQKRSVLSMHMEEKLDGDLVIAVAVRGYQRWLEGVVLSLEKGVQTPDDLSNTRFVRWYNGSGTARYGMNGAFSELWTAHVEVHAILRAIVALRAQGAGPEAVAVRLEALYQARDKVLECLARVERSSLKA
ncbi:hypothetical protein CKO35_12405 [Ectothiorhodospira shaposhnikovii]|uniref:putative bifunctional diguanylate cyclase/phosphodiesterase n=1 Tax=Ectothiorhodospira shaposhnikovii TaxID=1054 RepID=UPI00190426F3|nr:EAL domain-containing protein [Ectothiorhodospira shaposhnikovii]MBK1674091.1 hypothetical protein [Ectothiorhodospira shaposhnikovii]